MRRCSGVPPSTSIRPSIPFQRSRAASQTSPKRFPLQLAAERHAGLPGVDLRHGGLHADRSAPPEAEQQRPALPVLVHGEVAVEAEQEPRLVCRLTDVRAADDIARDAPCRGIGLHAVHLLAREREQRLAPARVGEAEDGAALRGAHFGENAVRGPHPEVVGAADDRRGVHRRRGRFRRRCLRQRAEHDAAASHACRRASDVGESDGRPAVHALRQGDEAACSGRGKIRACCAIPASCSHTRSGPAASARRAHTPAGGRTGIVVFSDHIFVRVKPGPVRRVRGLLSGGGRRSGTGRTSCFFRPFRCRRGAPPQNPCKISQNTPDLQIRFPFLRGSAGTHLPAGRSRRRPAFESGRLLPRCGRGFPAILSRQYFNII